MQLQLLDVSNNKLKSLPESIGSCFSLEELQANGKFLFSFSLNYHAPNWCIIKFYIVKSYLCRPSWVFVD